MGISGTRWESVHNDESARLAGQTARKAALFRDKPFDLCTLVQSRLCGQRWRMSSSCGDSPEDPKAIKDGQVVSTVSYEKVIAEIETSTGSNLPAPGARDWNQHCTTCDTTLMRATRARTEISDTRGSAGHRAKQSIFRAILNSAFGCAAQPRKPL